MLNAEVVTKVSDKELVLKIKENNCDDAVKELVGRHTPLIVKIYQKYSGYLRHDNKDINDNKYYILYNAAISYKPEKNMKFSSWLGTYTRYYCLNILNEKNGFILLDSKELDYQNDKTPENSNTENQVSQEYIDYILNTLTDKRIKQVFKLRFFGPEEKMTWRKIAKLTGFSSQSCINLFNRGKKILKNKIMSENTLDVL